MIPLLITTINPETKAITEFSKLDDVKLVIVGDKKTPEYLQSNIDYLSVDRQADEYCKLSSALPFNHYCRKNIGYVHINKNYGSSIFAETDDDNIPRKDWYEQIRNFDMSKMISSKDDWVNIYKYFTESHVWPRGFPLEKIQDSDQSKVNNVFSQNIGVLQGMADVDPYVDAIYRLVIGKNITFKEDRLFLDKGVYSPFNSQNTSWLKELITLAYLPCLVTFRYTDILRSMVAQRIMWEHGFNVGFTGPTVYQDRNEHDLMKDFYDEVPMYSNQLKLTGILNNINFTSKSLKDNIFHTYQVLEEKGIVPMGETAILNEFLSEL